jgi:hypothetical protein
MEPQAKAQLMDQLFSEIEQGWRRDRDRTLVYRLAEKHPELRGELYEFFEDLVLSDLGDVASETREAEESIARWIQSSGVDLAIAVAKNERPRTTTKQVNPVITRDLIESDSGQATSNELDRPQRSDDTWVALLRRRIRRSLPDLAKALPNVNVEYLVLVSRHPDIVPIGVCKALAAFVEDRWRVPADESLQCLSSRRLAVRAASRSRPFGKEPSTFDELLNRSALTSEQKTFWLRCATSEEECNS